MTLVKCIECGNEISTKAAACPKCGSPYSNNTNGSDRKFLVRKISTSQIIAYLFIGCLVALWLATRSGDKPANSTTTPQASHAISQSLPETDAQMVIATRKKMQAIEDKFDAQSNEFMRIMNKVGRKESLIGDENKPIGVRLDEMVSVLNESNDINVPNVQSNDGKKYLSLAVDAHKKWAIAQQAKLYAAIKDVDLDKAAALRQVADNEASQEGMNLMLAYKAIGATPEQ